MKSLPYQKPIEGRDYWVIDDALPDAMSVRERCLATSDWIEGYPAKPESWPGLRMMPGLQADEMAHIEALVMKATGSKKLWVETATGSDTLNHNCVQVVGEDECGPRPHTDSRKLCRFAAVLYLNPLVPAECGTSFYRQRLPAGQLGGNTVAGKHGNLVEALGSRFVPANSFVEDLRIDHRFNRLLVYRGNLVHSATSYWGHSLAEKRMTSVFFWMA